MGIVISNGFLVVVEYLFKAWFYFFKIKKLNIIFIFVFWTYSPPSPWSSHNYPLQPSLSFHSTWRQLFLLPFLTESSLGFPACVGSRAFPGMWPHNQMKQTLCLPANQMPTQVSCVFAHMCKSPWRPKALDPPRVGVRAGFPGSCEPPDLGA